MQAIVQSRIVYTLTIEDMVAYNLFYTRHSATIRKMQRRALISYPLGGFACALGVTLLIMPFWPSFFTALASAVWAVGYMLYYQKHGYGKRLRKLAPQMYAENKYPGLLGEHTLEVDEEGITHVSAYSRTRYAWGALERIESEPGYTYMVLGQQIFILRHDAILGGDFKAFLENIGRHHKPDQMMTHSEQITN